MVVPLEVLEDAGEVSNHLDMIIICSLGRAQTKLIRVATIKLKVVNGNAAVICWLYRPWKIVI